MPLRNKAVKSGSSPASCCASLPVTIYRVQGHDGRGPYKPGFSESWVDEDRDGSEHPPFFEEMGWEILQKAPQGYAIGCAFRSLEALRRWFSETELSRLRAYGYAVVTMEADIILGESERQLVFARRRPHRAGAKVIRHNDQGQAIRPE